MDDISKQSPEFCEGSSRQRNAPSIVELLAALACLEKPHPGAPIRFLNPAENAELVKLDNLPWPGGEGGAVDFSLFLHAACFTVRQRELPMDRGILQFLNDKDMPAELPFWPWVSEFLTDSSGKISTFKHSAGSSELSSYFLRLLFWAYRISNSRDDLGLVGWTSDMNAIPYWDALCFAKKGSDIPDIKEDGTAEFPHPIAVTMAAACASGLRNLRTAGKRQGPKLLSKTLPAITKATAPTFCNLPFVFDDFASAESAAELKISSEYANKPGT